MQESFSLTDIFKWAWSAIVPYLVWLHRRVDRVSEDTIKRSEYNDTIESLRREIREGNREITNRLDVFLSTLIKK